MARSRDVMNADPYKTMKPSIKGNVQPPERDVMNYRAPTRVNTPYDPKGVGLHGDNCGPSGSQGPYVERKQSSGAPGLGGDEIRMAGQQGKR